MGGKIDCYVDCGIVTTKAIVSYMKEGIAKTLWLVSPYSYFAFLYLQKNRAALRDHDVEVEFHPVFLGAVQKNTGNTPSWTLPAKANYIKFDRARGMQYFNAPNVKSPEVFPVVTVLPQRAQIYIKEKYSQSEYEAVYKALWMALWENNQDISKAPVLAKILEEHFSAQQVEDIVKAAQDPTYKQKLNDLTQEVLDKGAFGCPWHWVRNAEGKEEPFFGSDRFHHMWQFLGINWSDVTILPPVKKDKASL